MTMRTLKIRWAKKLLKAKYFVVLTDKESCITLDGVDPEKFTDILVLTSQTSELMQFSAALERLINEHARAIDKLMGASNKKATKIPVKKTGKSKKIEVKQR